MAPVNRPDGINNALNVYRQGSRNVQANRKDQSNATNNVNTPSGGGQVDEVVLSQGSGEVDRLKEQLNRLPDVDEEKVAKLREEINNGTYSVNSKQVAEKLLAAGINPNAT
ncbi:MAG: flagellar biosynthesis anti-sigma factor FlgM [Candidatus Poribacteria bacterium]|nr:flagellar biosynthesis anti-sigma factor FlgM [Candidatus Poribacteria bacterium]